MPIKSTGSSDPRPSAGSLLALAVFAGFVTGFLELAALAPELVGPRFCWCSRDALGTMPAFDALLFGILGFGLVAVARTGWVSWRVAAGMLAALGVGLALVHLPRLHIAARVLMALGAGVQVTRLLAGRTASAKLAIRRSLPWITAAVSVIAVGSIGWRAVHERILAGNRPAAAPGAPNILLLILDTVRAANMSLYGYVRPTTPVLEQFAAHATVFDRAFSAAPWTLPSHSSMFTGHWPFELEADWQHPLDPRWPRLAEVLRARGYATAAFAANDVYVNWESGLARGFEHFDDYPVSLWSAMQGTAFGKEIYPPLRRQTLRVFSLLPVLYRIRLPQRNQHRSAETIVDTFLRWVDHDRPAPFFAFLNFMDAHWPYTAPDAFRNRFRSVLQRPPGPQAWRDTPTIPLTPADVRPKLDIYDGSISYLDHQLGRLFQELERRGLLNNTLIVVVSDHGDEYAEHQVVDHGKSLYRLSLHVPLLIRFPGHVPEGRRVAQPVSLRNLAATILDLTQPGPAALPGRSLARFWNGGSVAPDTIAASVRQMENQPAFYPSGRGNLFSIAIDHWRYIHNQGDGGEELYDFESDLLERWNLVGTAQGERLLPRYQSALRAFLTARAGNRFATK